MGSELYIGIDIGTSSIRAGVFDSSGNLLNISSREYTMVYSRQRTAEIDPEVVSQSFIEVMRECIQKSGPAGRQIIAIGLSSQMHSVIAVDREGKCLTNIMTWADFRSANEAAFIEKNFDYRDMYNRTGCRIQHPMYPLSKILWIKNAIPDVFQKAYKFITVKEYILYRLFGEYVIDITDASGSGFFDIHKFAWDEDILHEVLSIESDKLGRPVECTYIMNGMDRDIASLIGVRDDIPVVIGSSDGIMATVGCGVSDDTSLSCTIGTSGALRTAVNKPLLDPECRTWCYCFTRDTWVAGGAVNNGGIVLKWFRDQYRDQFQYEASQMGVNNVYELFSIYASQVRPGSEGLIFLPYIAGERAPDWNVSAAGNLYGLRLCHNKRHFIRAAMEGVIFNMYSVYKILSGLDKDANKIIANGGYTNSDVWLQIQADVFERDIDVAGVSEASALGAAYVAMFAAGAVRDLKTPLPAMRSLKTIKPVEENVLIYRDAYRKFRDIYNDLFD